MGHMCDQFSSNGLQFWANLDTYTMRTAWVERPSAPRLLTPMEGLMWCMLSRDA